MGKYSRPTVETGENITHSGYYIYNGSPVHGQIPCYPAKSEKVIELAEGNTAPPVYSCNSHPAIWKLIVKKQSMMVQQTHSH